MNWKTSKYSFEKHVLNIKKTDDAQAYKLKKNTECQNLFLFILIMA